MLDSTKNKNDFLTYENCLYSSFSNNYSEKYNIEPILLMGIAKDSISENKLKNSIFLEKYDYLIGFCFSYGTEKDISLCSKSDYEELIKLIYSFFNDVIIQKNCIALISIKFLLAILNF